jgi:hypothetical protein
MSARARKPPTTEPPDRPSLDDAPTTIYDSDEFPAKRRAPSQGVATVVDKPVPRELQAVTKQPVPMQAISMKEQAPPIQAISMKTPGGAEKPPTPENPPTPILQRPQLRATSEVTPARQQHLGNLASPYDPKAARARALREYVIWGCLAVILASAIALVVWFVAR